MCRGVNDMLKFKRIILDIFNLFLVVYILFACLLLFDMHAKIELPLTEETAKEMGTDFLKTSFPELFNQEIEGQKIQMKIKAVDKGNCWEVFNYHETLPIETKAGQKIMVGQYSNYVLYEKETGDVIEVGFYE